MESQPHILNVKSQLSTINLSILQHLPKSTTFSFTHSSLQKDDNALIGRVYRTPRFMMQPHLFQRKTASKYDIYMVPTLATQEALTVSMKLAKYSSKNFQTFLTKIPCLSYNSKSLDNYYI